MYIYIYTHAVATMPAAGIVTLPAAVPAAGFLMFVVTIPAASSAAPPAAMPTAGFLTITATKPAAAFLTLAVFIKYNITS